MFNPKDFATFIRLYNSERLSERVKELERQIKELEERVEALEGE